MAGTAGFDGEHDGRCFFVFAVAASCPDAIASRGYVQLDVVDVLSHGGIDFNAIGIVVEAG